AGLEEHRLDERSLARRAVTDDGNVADLSGLDGHLAGFLLVSLAPSILSLRVSSGPGAGACLATGSRVMTRDPVGGHILQRHALVGERGRLSDLPAVVPGLRRRRDRRPAWDHATPGPPCLA